ncbi:MAG: SDR family oxidoreductase [Myxococcota bacterium]
MTVSSGRVLVTGASRGIGRATAETIVARGGRVVAVARDTDRLEALREAAPDQVSVLSADLTDTAALPALVDAAAGAFGGLDGVVNCAGIAVYQPVGEISTAAAEAQVRVNLLAPLFLMQSAARHLLPGSAIVNVSSTLAERVAPTTAVYAATKAGLSSLTQTFAAELASKQIRVNAVLPGVVDTDMVRGPRGQDDRREVEVRLDDLRRLHPLGRLGQPNEIAEVIVHLLDHPWQTGSLVVVDGGLLVA